MKDKNFLEIILICVLWAFTSVAYYLGEHRGRKNAEAECKPGVAYSYIDKHGELAFSKFIEDVYKSFYQEAVE